MGKSKNFLRLIAFILIQSFIASLLDPGYSYAQVSGGVETQDSHSLSSSIPPDLAGLNFPRKLGTIETSEKLDPARTVIILQDAHGLGAAQKSIREITRLLSSDYGVRLFGLEGASGKFDPFFFRSYPDSEKLQAVVEKHLASGELSGAVAGAILNPGLAEYQGVENRELYEEGVDLFLAAAENSKFLLARIEKLRKQIQREKQGRYSKELLAIDANIEKFKTGKDILQAVEFLKEKAKNEVALKNYPHAAAVFKQIEGARHPLSSREMLDFAAKLRTHVRNREAIASLQQKIQAYRTEALPNDAFAAFLIKAARASGVPVPVTLQRSAGNFEFIQEMRGEVFFEEIHALGTKLKDKRFKDQDQRFVDAMDSRADLLEKLVQLKLSRKEWEAITGKAEAAAAQTESKVLLDLQKEMETISAEVLSEESLFIRFYENAVAREKGLHDNLLKHMASAKTDRAVLVAGGFHARGFSELLKKENISYILVTPAIAQIEEKDKYLDYMRGQVSWKQYFQPENGRVDLNEAFSRAVRDELLQVKQDENNLLVSASSRAFLLKQWRDELIRRLAVRKQLHRAKDYTRFTDEAADKKKAGSREMLQKQWMAKVGRFIDGLKDLKRREELTPASFSKLLNAPAAGTNQFWAAVPAGNVPEVWTKGRAREISKLSRRQTVAPASRAEVRSMAMEQPAKELPEVWLRTEENWGDRTIAIRQAVHQFYFAKTESDYLRARAFLLNNLKNLAELGGEAYEERVRSQKSRAEQLFRNMQREYGPSMRDRLYANLNLGDMKTVTFSLDQKKNITHLVPQQNRIWALELFWRNYLTDHKQGGPIILLEAQSYKNGRTTTFILDGHHRVTDALLQNKTELAAHVIRITNIDPEDVAHDSAYPMWAIEQEGIRSPEDLYLMIPTVDGLGFQKVFVRDIPRKGFHPDAETLQRELEEHESRKSAGEPRKELRTINPERRFFLRAVAAAGLSALSQRVFAQLPQTKPVLPEEEKRNVFDRIRELETLRGQLKKGTYGKTEGDLLLRLQALLTESQSEFNGFPRRDGHDYSLSRIGELKRGNVKKRVYKNKDDKKGTLVPVPTGEVEKEITKRMRDLMDAYTKMISDEKMIHEEIIKTSQVLLEKARKVSTQVRAAELVMESFKAGDENLKKFQKNIYGQINVADPEEIFWESVETGLKPSLTMRSDLETFYTFLTARIETLTRENEKKTGAVKAKTDKVLETETVLAELESQIASKEEEIFALQEKLEPARKNKNNPGLRAQLAAAKKTLDTQTGRELARYLETQIKDTDDAIRKQKRELDTLKLKRTELQKTSSRETREGNALDRQEQDLTKSIDRLKELQGEARLILEGLKVKFDGDKIRSEVRSELRAKTFVEKRGLKHLQKRSVVSLQMEAAYHEGLLARVEKMFGEEIADLVAESAMTGGLGALMHDLAPGWEENYPGNVVNILPLWESIKEYPKRTFNPSLGSYVRKALLAEMSEQGSVPIEFELSLNLNTEFFNYATQWDNGRGSAAKQLYRNHDKQQSRQFKIRVFKTNTHHFGAPQYYIDAFYINDDGQEVHVMEEPYSDDQPWRAVHMALYAQASHKLIGVLKERDILKPEVVEIHNEAFILAVPPSTEMPPVDLSGTEEEVSLKKHEADVRRTLGLANLLMGINHSAVAETTPSLNKQTYGLQGFPQSDYPYIVFNNDSIRLVDYISQNYHRITGVSIDEHLGVLRANIFPNAGGRLRAYNKEDIRSTNGVLVEHWQSPLIQQLVKNYRKKLNLAEEAEDRDFYEAMNRPQHAELLAQFKKQQEMAKVSEVVEFYIWLAKKQGNDRWLKQLLADSEELNIDALRAFQTAVSDTVLSDSDSKWKVLEKRYAQLRQVAMKNPLVSNVRRQVPYKGPEKWLEILLKDALNEVFIHQGRETTLEQLRRLLADPLMDSPHDEKRNILRAVLQKANDEPDNWLTAINEQFQILPQMVALSDVFEHVRPQLKDTGSVAALKNESTRMVLGGRTFDPKAHGNFQAMKKLIQIMTLEDQFATVEGYNIRHAVKIFRGMSGVVMLSDEFLEASATSMMKGLVNGAASIMVWGGAGPELFAIVEAGTGKTINIFERKVPYEEVEKKIQDGTWKMTNSFLVTYSSEISMAQGGGRRPATPSLRHDLTNISGTFQDENSRQNLMWEALATTPKVNIREGQARAHLIMIDEMIAETDERVKLFAALKFNDRDLQKLLLQGKEEPAPFAWYQHDGHRLPVSEKNGTGLLRLVEDFRQIATWGKSSERGKIAAKSMRYHALRNDLFNYVRNILNHTSEDLKPLSDRIRALGEEAEKLIAKRQKAPNDEVKESLALEITNLNYELIELLDSLGMLIASDAFNRYVQTSPKSKKKLKFFHEEIFSNRLLRKYMGRVLDKDPRAISLKTSERGIRVYRFKKSGNKEILVSLNVGSKPVEQSGRFRAVGAVDASNREYQDYLDAQHIKTAFYPRNVMTGENFSTYNNRSTDLFVGIDEPEGIQLLELVPKDEEALKFLPSAEPQSTLRSKIPDLKARLRDFIGENAEGQPQYNLAGLHAFLSGLASLPKNDARNKFGVHLPTMMALIAGLSPELLEQMKSWDSRVYQSLKATIEANPEIFSEGRITFHAPSRDATIVFSRSLGGGKDGENVLFALEFAPEHKDDKGKVWSVVRELGSDDVEHPLNLDRDTIYEVESLSWGIVFPIKRSGAELLQHWDIGVSVWDPQTQKPLWGFDIYRIAPEGKRQEDFFQPSPVLSDEWWKNPKRAHLVEAGISIGALRRPNDSGIGKYGYLPEYQEKFLAPNGVDTMLLLPFHPAEDSPYGPFSQHALNEDYIDWSLVSEVSADGEQLALLKAPEEEQASINLKAVRERERKVMARAAERFFSEKPASRYAQYEKFVKRHQVWLEKYVDFMALREIIGRPFWHLTENGQSEMWKDGEVERARSSDEYAEIAARYRYAQWIAYIQFSSALKTLHEKGMKILFDRPAFFSKDSAEVFNNRFSFLEVKDPHRYPGIVIPDFVNEHWRGLALPNWEQLATDDYQLVLDPVRHWLNFGLDGGRIDAGHFAFDFHGKLGAGKSPGAAYVQKLGQVFKDRKALPVAEAFEGKHVDYERAGFVTIFFGNWRQITGHDDEKRVHKTGFHLAENVEDALSRNHYTDQSARFVSISMGSLWADTKLIKEMKDGPHGRESQWTYRLPLPGDEDYEQRVNGDAGLYLRNRLQVWKAIAEGDVWKAQNALEILMANSTDAFVHRHPEQGRVDIWAAAPPSDWFHEPWGRDTFISLVGLLVTTGRLEEAKRVIAGFAEFETGGLIPNRIWTSDAGNAAEVKKLLAERKKLLDQKLQKAGSGEIDEIHRKIAELDQQIQHRGFEYNNADGSMWFLRAVEQYTKISGDYAFAQKMRPVMKRIIDAYNLPKEKATAMYHRYGERQEIYSGADGLTHQPRQASWMDADPSTGPVTPRNGKTVETNALKYYAIRFVQDLERRGGSRNAESTYRKAGDRLRVSFNEKFWNTAHDENAFETPLFDVIEGDPHGGAIRPNMLWAVFGNLLSPARKKAVVETAMRELWTPYGPRTLSPRDSYYKHDYADRQAHGVHTGNNGPKDEAYHQGPVWPWLTGVYVDALREVWTEDEEKFQAYLRKILSPLVLYWMQAVPAWWMRYKGVDPMRNFEPGIPEIFDPGRPEDLLDQEGHFRRDAYLDQRPGGTPKQAWSEAELLRVLVKYGLLNPDAIKEASLKFARPDKVVNGVIASEFPEAGVPQSHVVEAKVYVRPDVKPENLTVQIATHSFPLSDWGASWPSPRSIPMTYAGLSSDGLYRIYRATFDGLPGKYEYKIRAAIGRGEPGGMWDWVWEERDQNHQVTVQENPVRPELRQRSEMRVLPPIKFIVDETQKYRYDAKYGTEDAFRQEEEAIRTQFPMAAMEAFYAAEGISPQKVDHWEIEWVPTEGVSKTLYHLRVYVREGESIRLAGSVALHTTFTQSKNARNLNFNALHEMTKARKLAASGTSGHYPVLYGSNWSPENNHPIILSQWIEGATFTDLMRQRLQGFEGGLLPDQILAGGVGSKEVTSSVPAANAGLTAFAKMNQDQALLGRQAEFLKPWASETLRPRVLELLEVILKSQREVQTVYEFDPDDVMLSTGLGRIILVDPGSADSRSYKHNLPGPVLLHFIEQYTGFEAGSPKPGLWSRVKGSILTPREVFAHVIKVLGKEKGREYLLEAAHHLTRLPDPTPYEALEKEMRGAAGPAVLVVGASGYVGQEVLKALQKENPLTGGTSFQHGQAGLETLDVTSEDSVRLFFETHEAPEFLIYAAAEASPDVSEKDPAHARRLNVEAVKLLRKYFKGSLIYFSTDYIFDGEKAPYAADAAAQPVNMYGQTKLEGEQATFENGGAGNAVIRLGFMYSSVANPAKNIVQKIVAGLEQETPEPMTFNNEQLRHPVSLQEVVDFTLSVIKEKKSGVFQLNGDKSMTMYEFAKLVVEVYYDTVAGRIPEGETRASIVEKMIRPAPVAAAPQTGIQRPRNARMISSITAKEPRKVLAAILPKLSTVRHRVDAAHYDNHIAFLERLKFKHQVFVELTAIRENMNLEKAVDAYIQRTNNYRVEGGRGAYQGIDPVTLFGQSGWMDVVNNSNSILSFLEFWDSEEVEEALVRENFQLFTAVFAFRYLADRIAEGDSAEILAIYQRLTARQELRSMKDLAANVLTGVATMTLPDEAEVFVTRANENFDGVVTALRSEARNIKYAELWQENAQKPERFLASHPDYQIRLNAALESLITDTRARAEAILEANPYAELNYSFAVSLVNSTAQTRRHLRNYLEMISQLKAAHPEAKIKARFLVLLNSRQRESAAFRSFAGFQSDGILKFAEADKPGVAIALADFLRENNSALVYGINPAAGQLSAEFQPRFVQSQVSLESELPVAFILSDHLAENAQLLKGDLLRQLPGRIARLHGSVIWNGQRLEVTVDALALVYQDYRQQAYVATMA